MNVPDMETCSVEGCGRDHYANGLCNKHWQRARKGKNPLIRTRFEKSPKERLKERLAPNPVTGCMEWTGGRSGDGYGAIKVSGIQTSTHRLAYEIAFGPIPEGMLICHTCDNPVCCNADHLFLGTVVDNSADMVAKGRSARVKGENHNQAKLTEKDVAKIRRRLALGELHRVIAADFRVHKVTISQINTGKTWK